MFFAIENGVDYVTNVALYNIHGLFAALAFSYGYYLSTFYSGKLGIFLSLMISFLSYVIIALVLSLIPPHIVFTPLIVIVLMIGSSIYFAKKENFAINKSIKTSVWDIIFRSVLTISIFLLVTSLPNYVPQNIAGIFSAFPTILLPLLLIIHLRHSNLQARTIIKNTPFGLSSVVIYSLSVFFTYGTIGVFYGTLVSLFLSVVYIVIQTKLLKYFKLVN
ncbi:hypothetical protein GCM10012288_17630 [Malaciobacter pacificus]|uniref:Uncharacterized protein n=1 Tax=Malaciobacter pacificus TaxID=1080223 RepID=A0A5C2H772_9BACT|nr:hypothetical protein [Malaciobacter pacificus]QEP34801.1 hypothetical protein APAC_1705 [Malaciobacter pacificus]GGD43758.1 hypothetical protein GCM10012288_17630 [Malaciobacter pacificus]